MKIKRVNIQRLVLKALAVSLLLLLAIFLFYKRMTLNVSHQSKNTYVYSTPTITVRKEKGDLFYTQTVYSLIGGSSEVLLNSDVLASKYIGGPVRPVLDPGNNMLYFASGPKVFEYNLVSKSKKQVYDAGGDSTIDLLKFVNPNLLYITKSKVDFEFDSAVLNLMEFNTSSKTIKALGSQEVVVYGNLEFLGKNGNTYVIGTFGGDGCGGYGEVYSVNKGHKNLILKTGGGCAPGPRYVGYSDYNNSVITVSLSGQYEVGKGQKNEFVYLTKVDTLEKKAIYDLKRLSETVSYLVKDPYQEYLYLFTEKNSKVYVLDLKDYQVVNEVNFGVGLNGYGFRMQSDSSSSDFIFENWNGSAGKKKTYRVVNLEKGVQDEVLTAPKSGALDLIGKWKDQLLLVDYEGPKYN